MKKTRRKFTSSFKTKVVLEALKERLSIQELAEKHNVHPTQISNWKTEFLSNASSAFDKGDKKDQKETEKEKDDLYNQIGRLKMENEWLKKKLE